MITEPQNASDWPIKYVWEGTFRYPLTKDDGHQWYYHDTSPPRSFNIWRSRNQTPEEFHPAKESLRTIAKAILSPKVFEQIPLRYRDPSYFKFTHWLAGDAPDQPVKSGLSVVLNSIVLDATLKSFRIVTSFVDSHATVHVQGLKELEPQWFYLHDQSFPFLREEEMLVAPSIFFELNSAGRIVKVKDRGDFEQARQFRFLRVRHQYTVTNLAFTDDDIVLSIKDQVTMSRYKKGELCGCIPVPAGSVDNQKGTEPEDVLSPEVVVASPVVSNALESLSRIWQDRNTKKSVLISSPPGSGKEVFCSGIVSGNGRPLGNFQSLSMASEDQENLEKILFGHAVDGIVSPGLIAKAAKSGIFLDEVHQPEKGDGKNNSPARAALLRLLEAGNFLPKGSSVLTKVENVLFIMATSKSRTELKNFNPPDFWTRMTHFVEIPHPLTLFARTDPTDEAIPLDEKRKLDNERINEVLEKFFNFFWWERVDNFYEIKRGDDKHLLNYSEKLLTWQKKALLAVVEEGWSSATINKQTLEKLNRSGAPLEKPGVVFTRAVNNALAAQLPEPLKPYQCSIRGIRNMVCRLFSIAAARVFQGEDVLPEPSEFAKTAEQIAREIVPIANIKTPASAAKAANA